MLTNVQLVNALMVQLDALQVTGVTNCARIYDMYQMLKSLKEALEKEEAANGNTSDREKEIPCDFAEVVFDGTFLAQYHDDRRLPEIAMDFDGLPEVTVIEPVLEKHYAGFSWLAGVSITADGTVQVRLRKEVKADE